MFTPSNMLLKYLNAQSRDMYDVVGAIMGYINADPYFKTNDFEEAIQYVLAHGVRKEELFATFNSDLDYSEDESTWSNEYYSYARVYLKDNFCEKRIAHVKAVARKLHPISQVTTNHVDSERAVRMPVASQNTRATQDVKFTGEQQTNGKKYQDQQKRKESYSISPKHVIMGVGCVLLLAMLVVIIVSIIK